jgi:hypothetical protein
MKRVAGDNNNHLNSAFRVAGRGLWLLRLMALLAALRGVTISETSAHEFEVPRG